MKQIISSYILFLTCSFAAFSKEKDLEIPEDIIYKSCGTYLFDQETVTKSESYQLANQAEREALLESEFNWRRKLCYADEFKSTALTLIPSGLIAWYMYRRINGNGANPAAAAVIAAAPGVAAGADIGAGMFAVVTLGNIFGPLINDLTQFISIKIRNAQFLLSKILSPSTTDPMEKDEIRYVKRKPGINKDLQDILEEIFINARAKSTGSQHPNYRDSYSGSPNPNSNSKSPIEFARNVLALPTNKTEVTYNSARLEKFVGSYNEKTLSQFKRFAVRHAAASTGESVKKIVAYFQGPPGVGKTRAAEKIANALQVPFYVIKVGEKSVKDLEGDPNTPGLILDAYLRAKYEGHGAKNMIILFDEIDRALGMTPHTPICAVQTLGLV